MGESVAQSRQVYAAYAALAMPLAFLGLPLYIYLPTYYAKLPEIGLALSGAVLLAARLIDLITDPIVGGLVDRYRHRIGYRTLILLSAPLLIVGVWFLFIPPDNAGPLYLFFSVSLTYLAWTLLSVPYYAWGAELAVHKKGQVELAAWREAGVIIGMLLALIAPLVVADDNKMVSSVTWIFWLLCFAMLVLWFVPVAHTSEVSFGSIGLRKTWRDTSKPVRKLLILHFANTLANGIPATLFLLYADSVLGLTMEMAGIMLLVYFLSAILALPLWAGLAKHVGRVSAWRYAILLSVVGFIPAVFLGQGDAFWFLLICIVTGASAAADIAIPAAIQAGFVHKETKSLARPRAAALFGLWGMVSKLALAFAVGISLPLLDLLTAGSFTFPEQSVLPWLYAGIAVLVKLSAAGLLSFERKLLEANHADDATSTVTAPVHSGGGL